VLVFYWIYDHPSAQVGAMFAFVFVALTWVATLALHRYFHSWFHSERRANDMVGFALSSFSVLYGLLVGLIAVAAYQNFGNVTDIVVKEASSLAAMYRDLGGYPQPIRGRLQEGLREYTRHEIDSDWPQQQRGVVPSEGTYRLQQFMDDLVTFKPADRSEEILYAETLRQLNDFMDLRRSRLNNVTLGIPSVLWWVVGIGALICVLLIAMLDMEIHVHLILGGALSCFLGLVIFLIAAMDNPFRGQVSVTPEPFESLYAMLMQPNDAVRRAMTDLIGRTSMLGDPRLEGREPVAGKDVPALYFGRTKINNSFAVVDQVGADGGGTATLFVRSGEQYVRVATNAKTSDGTRAIGTILDPKGAAIERIRSGQAYYGTALILGVPYITGYEPIIDASGYIIGIYSTAYQRR
jgi:hypothetical protein